MAANIAIIAAYMLLGGFMPERDEWEELSRNIIKSELVRKGIDYPELSMRLKRFGIKDGASNINSKINRGKFSFTFFLQCMHVINTETVNIGRGEYNV